MSALGQKQTLEQAPGMSALPPRADIPVPMTSACPAQWEGRTEGDRPVYVRYRWGYLSVRVGPPGGNLSSAVGGITVYGEQIGDELDGSIEWVEVRDRIKPIRLSQILRDRVEADKESE